MLEEIDKVVGIGRVEQEAKELTLFPELSGRITHVNASMGEQVSAGAVLVEMDHRTEELQVQKLLAQIEEQKVSIREIETRVEKARLNATSMEREFLRQQSVAEKGVGVGQNLDNAESAWKLALQDIKTYQAQIESIKAGMQVLNVDKQLLQQNITNYYLKAPAAGMLLRVDALVGQSVSPETALGVFVPQSPINVVTEIDELFATRVALGQKAYIRQQGGVDTLATGIVIEIAPSLRQKSLFSDEIGKLEDRRVRPVRVRIEQGQEKLIYGQRVECVINLGI
ncbi:MAG: HlyD family efflux transporter periplasmic adaptor subunit [Saprospirales bacterium]|nr:HlyD family efflux transporter periplasmic adaptor subunit [Saprospirales bacterium]